MNSMILTNLINLRKATAIALIGTAVSLAIELIAIPFMYYPFFFVVQAIIAKGGLLVFLVVLFKNQQDSKEV